MKNNILLLVVSFLLSSSVFISAQTRNVDNFNSIHASTSVTVSLVKANTPSIEFTMKKGSAEDLITEVKNGRLYVKIKSKMKNWGSSAEASVTVYYTNLNEISASAGCSIASDDVIKSNTMEVNVSSGSTAMLEIETNMIDVDVSSGSTLKLKGKANKGHFDSSSGSTLNAYHFITDDAVVEASSGSSMSIHVDDTMEASAGSGASISYTGDVKKKNIDAGWSGSINRRN